MVFLPKEYQSCRKIVDYSGHWCIERRERATNLSYRSVFKLSENSIQIKSNKCSCNVAPITRFYGDGGRRSRSETLLKFNDEYDMNELSRKQIKLTCAPIEMNNFEENKLTVVESDNVESVMTQTPNNECSTSSINDTDHCGTDALSSRRNVEELNIETVDTNKLPCPLSQLPSSSSSSESDGLPVENEDDSMLFSSFSSDTSSSTSSSSSSSPSPSSSENDSDADFHRNNIDGDSSNDEQSSSRAEQIPDVLKKTLPIDKFSLIKALTERQWKADDVRRKFANRFDRRMYASRSLTQRLELHRLLQKHNGCVNCISFNDVGNILISGSDDRHVCLWDWSRGRNLLYFDTEHVDNVLQAKFLPNSGDTKLVTCSRDGQIRLSTLDQCGLKNISMIINHGSQIHNLALQKQMPNTFLSACEDGVVYSIDIRDSKPLCTKLANVKLNYTKRKTIPFMIYSIHCNPIKNYEFIVCGTNKKILLFDQRNITAENPKPVITFMPNRDINLLNATCSVFNYNGTEILSSYNDNRIYLFDAQSGKEVHCYDGHRNFETIKGVNFYGPCSEYIVSGSDCGYIFLWDKNSEAIVQWMKGDKKTVNCSEPHPAFPILATSGIEKDVKIWAPTKDGNDIEDIVQLKKFRTVTRRNYFEDACQRRIRTQLSSVYVGL